ncbi:hypothetical protein Gorai_015020 [Gossypium raimondii]|uniref:Uncharacterized protein n=1 Tax=Gossypium raimondii TaxID=29730 RepID=A0A7J8P4L7_GOSRA|nr:hypothetical protein [Gossypium raimondii]
MALRIIFRSLPLRMGV